MSSLRDQIAQEIHLVLVRGHHTSCAGCDRAADMVMAVVQPALDAQVAAWRTERERAEQAEAERDRLRKRLTNSTKVSLAKGDEITRLTNYLAAATAAARRADQLRELLTEILTHFHEHGHPGRPALRTCWVDADVVTKWRHAATLDIQWERPPRRFPGISELAADLDALDQPEQP